MLTADRAAPVDAVLVESPVLVAASARHSCHACRATVGSPGAHAPLGRHQVCCGPRRHSSAVEQLFRKQQVLGSNPSVGSTPCRVVVRAGVRARSREDAADASGLSRSGRRVPTMRPSPRGQRARPRRRPRPGRGDRLDRCPARPARRPGQTTGTKYPSRAREDLGDDDHRDGPRQRRDVATPTPAKNAAGSGARWSGRPRGRSPRRWRRVVRGPARQADERADREPEDDDPGRDRDGPDDDHARLARTIVRRGSGWRAGRGPCGRRTRGRRPTPSGRRTGSPRRR